MSNHCCSVFRIQLVVQSAQGRTSLLSMSWRQASTFGLPVTDAISTSSVRTKLLILDRMRLIWLVLIFLTKGLGYRICGLPRNYLMLLPVQPAAIALLRCFSPRSDCPNPASVRSNMPLSWAHFRGRLEAGEAVRGDCPCASSFFCA